MISSRAVLGPGSAARRQIGVHEHLEQSLLRLGGNDAGGVGVDEVEEALELARLRELGDNRDKT